MVDFNFSSDITIPLGHRCMGVLKTKANRIDDPLQAHGLLIKGPEPAIVLVALDWCEYVMTPTSNGGKRSHRPLGPRLNE